MPRADAGTEPTSTNRMIWRALLFASLAFVAHRGFSQDPSKPGGKGAAPQPLLILKDPAGGERPVKTRADWTEKVAQIRSAMQRVMGPLPDAARSGPLNVETVSEEKTAKYLRRKVKFTPEPGDRVPAWLLIPNDLPAGGKAPAMLCLHQTTRIGKDEPAGVGGGKSPGYARELAERGYICLVPDYPSFGEYPYDFAKQGARYDSGSMKAIWNNIRAVDLLISLPQVDARRIGVIGHSLGGHNAMFTAAFDERLRAIVSSCGFTTFHKDDMPSWAGPVYMPRIRTEFGNDAARMPFDFTDVVASFAPRAFLASSADGDTDFDVSGVRDVMAAARAVYEFHGAATMLEAHYAKAPHSFPDEARKAAYEWLDRVLK